MSQAKRESRVDYYFSTRTLAIPLYTVLLLWLVYWFEVRNGYNFNHYGIYPRSLSGIRGIVLGPLIHGDIKHLYHNSIPLFVLMLSLFYFYRSIALRVIIQGTLLAGILTWLIARPSYHIGASGIIYMLFSFVFLSGVLRKNSRLIAVSLTVIFLYGSMVWYLLPVEESISWEGHLSGFLVGIYFAFRYRYLGPQIRKFEWEEEGYEPDEFDEWFDEEGNFDPERANRGTEGD